ncbi:MAG: ATP-binding cassette domain-containing protein, partial [Thermoleophilia bacterium]|nr:ATP-binding cassette domain-containing protein [Thermoleophilia bacterium]
MEGEQGDIARLDRDDERPQAGRRVKRALASFGLTIDEAATASTCGRDELDALAAELDARLGPSTVALITGPSGAGKSTLLATLSRRARSAGQRVIDAAALPEPGDERAIVDLFAAPPEGDHGSLALLASVGLGDATLLPRPARSLSGGQRARLGIALALDAARAAGGQPTLIIVDELGSGLDDLTARGVCAGIRRAIDRAGPHQHVRIACASANEGLEHALCPDTLLRLDAAGRARFDERSFSSAPPTLTIEPGTMADYRALAR